MVTESASDFDLGPLSWVQAEIDQALTRGLDCLAAFSAKPGDLTQLKHARAHVHQAAGAIQMVGLDAVVVYTDEVERHLARFEQLEAAEVPQAVAIVDQACRKLRIFLDETINGAAPVPLRLFPEFEAMQRARGVQAVAPTELFYPDLSATAPRTPPREVVAASRMPSLLIRQRRLYQRGLLAWLRGDEAGAKAMRDAIAGIEDATPQANLRAFWWSAGALFESITAHGVDSGFGLKQLAARIDLQIRRVAEGGAKVADRLRREVLYYVAISAPVGPTVQAVQQSFRLAGLIPSAAVIGTDVVGLQPLIREAREQLAAAKDTWLKFASGRAENLGKLKSTLTSVHTKAAQMKQGALMKLTSALVERLDRMPASAISEPLAMEYATGLLLAESAFENHANLSPEFPQQVDQVIARLDAARAGRTPPGGTIAVLDEMGKRAQERVLLAQVGREIQANLRHMEQVLDAFFRNHDKRTELATLTRDSQQIRGALSILGLTEAERLLAMCQEQIEGYANPETPVSDDDLELLAESLSGLGFYVEAVEQQRPDRERLIAPLIARRLGEAPAPIELHDSVEMAVAELRAQLPALVEELGRAPADAEARNDLRRKLTALRDDAELIGDAALAAQASQAAAEVDAGAESGLAAVVDAIAGASAPAPELSEETQRLLEVDAHGLDAELVDIFLTEAAEVVDTIRQQADALERNLGDREALATVRRGFHTLKGSGRMVGLVELGEYAYEAEKLTNRLLEEERPVSAAVLRMVRAAESSFRNWVDALRERGKATLDAKGLHEAIRAVEAELPGRESVIGPLPKDDPALSLVASAPVKSIAVAAGGASQSASLAEAAPAAGPHAHANVGPDPVVIPITEDGDGDEGLDADGELGPSTDAGPRDEAPIDAAPIDAATMDAATMDAATMDAAIMAGSSVVAVSEVPVQDFGSLPELGSGSIDQPLVEVTFGEDETVDFAAPASGQEARSTEVAREGHPVAQPALKLVADNARPILHFATAEPRLVAVAAPAPEGAVESDEIRIGEIALSGSLWRILVDEAQQHIATLEHELSILQFDPQFVPSPAMVRASHTLCGIHRTGGFQLIAALAKALELTLMALAQRGAPLTAAAHPVLTRAVSGLRGLVESVLDKRPFLPRDVGEVRAIHVELDGLRQQAMTDAEIDAEFEAERAAAREDDLGDGGTVVPDAGQPTLVPAASTIAAPEELALSTVVAVAEVDPLAEVRDEIEDREVLEIFLEEAADLYPEAGTALRSWRRMPEDGAAAQQLRRTLHTLKGSARMAGAMRLGELTHLMESRLLDGDDAAPATAALFEALDADLDRIAYVLDRLRAGETNVALPSVANANGIDEASAAPTGDAVAGTSPHPALTHPADPTGAGAGAAPVEPVDTAGLHAEIAAPAAAESSTAELAAPVQRADPPEAEAGARAMLRVRADIIDRLVNEAGEVAISRARVEGELRALKNNLLELTGSVIRLRSQLREIEIQSESQIQSRMTLMQEHQGEFDPLEFDRFTRFQELTRSLAEGVNDVSTVQLALLRNLDDADAALLAQARMSREVQQHLFAIRTVPFGSLSERLYRIMRSVARELGKRANLDIVGAQTELDRSVLEKLVGPLEHLLRNALDHGVESGAARRAAGKPEQGEITLTVRQAGNEVVIELADDGAGLDRDRILAKARATGLVAADVQPTDAQILECIFKPGFSTASKVTAISGRGVGMDVVRAEIATLGGRVEVASERDRGTRFTLTLPLTLAVAQAVLVRAGGRLWALPAPMVEQVQQIREQALLDIYVKREVEWQGKRYPFHYLPRLLGDTTHNPETRRHNSVLLLKTGQGTAAIHVDEMVGNQEIVVKNIGPQLARVSGISGATVLGTGEIVLIIHPVQLAQRANIPHFDPEAEAQVQPAEAAAAGPPLVMIVDDSLTVRKITSRFLAREGFAVMAAKDGVDALQLLTERTPDVILLDIEMPRMDGFEFTKTIKRDPQHAHVPIIMITSRTADKHRARAAELGVDLYLGKPYQEEELLRNLRDMLGIAVPA